MNDCDRLPKGIKPENNAPERDTRTHSPVVYMTMDADTPQPAPAAPQAAPESAPQATPQAAPQESTGPLSVSCDVCRDLMPLVCDGVASDDSAALVEQHVAHCAPCRALYEGAAQESTQSGPDDARVLRSLRRKILLRSGLFAGAGALGAVLLMKLTGGAYYVVWWLPLIGLVSYFVLRRRWWLAPVVLAALTAVGLFAFSLLTGQLYSYSLFNYPLTVAIQWALLTLLGEALGALLHFALGKEKS